MSATEELRRLLDERGVEWWEGEDERKTHWRSNGLTWEYFNTENGDAWLGFLGACESDISPEQAVEATLGSDLNAENAKLRDELDFCLKQVPNCDECEAMLDCDECLRADSSQKERKRLDYENAELREQLQDAEHEESVAWDRVRSAERRTDKLRELVRELLTDPDAWDYDYFKHRMRELGVEV